MPPRRGRGRGRGAYQRRGSQRGGLAKQETQIEPKVEDIVDEQKLDATEEKQNGVSVANNNAEPIIEPEIKNEVPDTPEKGSVTNEIEVKPEIEPKVEEKPVTVEETANNNESANLQSEMKETANNSESVNVQSEVKETTNNNESVNAQSEVKETTNNNESVDLDFKVKVSHLPANYFLHDFQKYLQKTFNIDVTKVITPSKNSPWILLPFATKEEQDNCIKHLHNHVWKKKALRAIAFYGTTSQKRELEDGIDSEGKKIKLDYVPILTLEEEILSESLPLYNVPYEEQNRLTLQDVQLLSNKLHAFMCVRNPALAGWAEAMIQKNNGTIFKIEPLKPSVLLKGYRNKCKFRIGKNTEGETTVGFCLNDNENKILGVQPGDKLIHLPDSMKYAAKKFEEFIRASGKKPYDKKKKTGFWDHITIRIAPEGNLMLVIVMYHNQLTDEAISEIKKEVKEFFINGNGKDCKLYSLYFQVMNDRAPMLPPDRLELLHGEPHFYENICGLKFHVGPFSILNVNSSSSENIYNSIAELAEPTSETTILDLGCGTGGIAFTIAKKCKNVIAIESQEDHIKDALKTKELNNIQNVEFIKGKVEDVLPDVFKSLGDATVIPIIDPPRQGLGQKAISQLRAQESIKKLVYVCSNSKMGGKNFLDLCASAEKKQGTFGNPLNVVFSGLPFLPVRAIPVDVAPYTVNNTIIILFERIDPSTYPPATNPPPEPLKKPQVQKDGKKKRRTPRKRMRGPSNQRGKGFRSGGFGEPFPKKIFKGPQRKEPKNFNSHPGSFNQTRFQQPIFNNRPLEPALSLVAKYERRIAELEQQDRAFKAGLTMGLQALGTRSGQGGAPGGNFESFGSSFSSGVRNFGNYGNQIIGDNPAWQRGGGNRNFDNTSNMNFNSDYTGGGEFSGGGFNSFNSRGGFNNFGGGGNFNSNFKRGRNTGRRNNRGRRRR